MPKFKKNNCSLAYYLPQIASTLALLLSLGLVASAQTTVGGAFEGTVKESLTGNPVEGALVEIIYIQNGKTITRVTNSRGGFYQGNLQAGSYRIRVSKSNFQPRETSQRIFISQTGQVIPVPVTLDPASAPPSTPVAATDNDLLASINTTDARRSGSFTENEATALPLGATTVVKSFDELALLLPGLAPPPQTIGNTVGPGVGAGVGTAGQFAANGLRSRANNFTVDGSDNNDEDIGVRRQGFVALTPQPIESVKEYQVISLLAPAQFGRNLGAQVNAVSKSGGSEVHGSLYGLFNSSQLNARNAFDTNFGNASTPLQTADGRAVLLDGQPMLVRNQSGGKDSFTFGSSGFTLGGPLKRDRTFYFFSGEGQRINASEEHSFAVPTVEQRGAFNSGATGIFRDPFTNLPTSAVPAGRNGSAVFNLYPFPNNPQGVYGANTFTQVLPASAWGVVASGRLDHNFKVFGREHSAAGRYNFTRDRRILPVTGEAIYSSLQPRVQAQNFSFFLNSEVSAPLAPNPVFNQLRFSYGRTNLDFREVRDREFLIPSRRYPNIPFLLNARLRLNVTAPPSPGTPNSDPVNFVSIRETTTNFIFDSVEDEIGAVGQVMIAGFSPLGVDVYNFPQQRVNNTYQLSDFITLRRDRHSFTFGFDNRRTELHSDLPRNSRPLATFNGGPRLIFENGALRFPTASDPTPVIQATDLAAFGGANNFFLTLNTSSLDSRISLRFYQLNFFGQDEWRFRPNLSISAGLRYEYNTPPREMNGRIERTFSDPALSLAPGLNRFLEGRTGIFDPDRNNFGPRLSVAYSPTLFGKNRATVIRGGYGMFYDQILGAVASQSRNVFPTFLAINFGGGVFGSTGQFSLSFFNPSRVLTQLANGDDVPLLAANSTSRLNPQVQIGTLLEDISRGFPSALSATLASRRLETPLSHHYAVTVEQQLGSDHFLSFAYVGTQGRQLLRFTTPNLGSGSNVTLTAFQLLERPVNEGSDRMNHNFPNVLGRLNVPRRPEAGIGAVYRFETSAESRYDSLQLQLRGRLRSSLQYQTAYTLSKVNDDVSDVFDLAGAFELPQNSLTLTGERGPSNFDVRHRFSFNLLADLPGGIHVAGLGRLQTGQPFTVNSILDINLDGNLTDRLDSTAGLAITDDRRQPLKLTTTTPLDLLAIFGQDGRIGRNTFRAGNVIEIDFAVLKSLVLAQKHKISLRMDAFNLINRANYGIPARLLEAPGFGKTINTTVPGRRLQFSLKYEF